jgi:hypothetical protein
MAEKKSSTNKINENFSQEVVEKCGRERLRIVDGLILGRTLQKPVWKHGLDSADPGWIMGFDNHGLEPSGFRGSRNINGSVDRPTNLCYHLHCDTELTDKSCGRCGGT